MASSRPRSVEAKLDPELRVLLRRRDAGRDVAALPTYERRVQRPLAAAPALTASVFLSYSGDLEALRALGFRPSTVGRTVATGTIELDRVAELAAHPRVLRIKLAQKGKPLLDKSLPAIGADAVHRAPLESRGEGVVVGVIDAGIDFRHPCFIQADEQSTRILFLWDQTLTRDIGEHPPTAEGFDYGVEYDQDDIDEALEGFEGSCRHEERKESKGHGTHVAGIAAGDGSVAGNCRGTETFVGVAPDADLIIVRYDRTETGVVDAINYIFQKAAARGQAAVVNVSQSTDFGPRDGTTEFDELIDDFLNVAGRAVVFSSGNDGDKDLHAQDTLTPASADPQTLEIVVEPETDGPVTIDLWYPRPESLSVTVRAPGAVTDVPAVPVTLGDDALLGFLGLTTTGTIDHELNVRNLDRNIRITLEAADDDVVEPGTWQVILHGVPTADMTYHAWVDHDGDTGGAKFVTPQLEASGTLNPWATGARVITVGSFATEGERNRQLADASGRGPTRDGRRKPDLVAPGVAITSARARASVDDTCCCDCCVDMYADKNGTSMAAPHVTGVVALLLEQDAGLTIAEIRDTLIDTARAPVDITPLPVLPNDDWGAGIVNAVGAVNDVAPAQSIRGGSGGVRPAPAVIPSRAATTPSALSATPAVTALRQRALATPAGQLYAALVSRHFSEIRALINANRRVATLWHRMGGTLLVRRLLREAEGRRAVVPEGDGAAPRREPLDRFFAAVARFASPALRDDLARHGDAFIGFVLAGLSGVPRGGTLEDATRGA